MRYAHVSNKIAQKLRNPFDNIKFGGSTVKNTKKII